MITLAGEDSGKAGPLGLLIVVLLGIACYILFKSMSGHLRKVQNGFADVAPTRRPMRRPAATEEAQGATGIAPQPSRPAPEPPADSA